jgi:hypothetical protein
MKGGVGPSALIEPDVQISRIRLSDKTSRLCSRVQRLLQFLNIKAGGYKVVFMKPKFPVKTIASYDQLILKEIKGASSTDTRPTSSVVRTISE